MDERRRHVTGLTKHYLVSHVEAASRFRRSAAYVTFDGHTSGDMKPYVYKTADFRPDMDSSRHRYRRGLLPRDSRPESANLLFLGTELDCSSPSTAELQRALRGQRPLKCPCVTSPFIHASTTSLSPPTAAAS